MILQDLHKKNLINFGSDKFILDNTIYLTIMGSQAYGCADNDSDYDVYGCCIPPKEIVFPHLAGEIIGFGRQVKRFDQFQKHRIFDQDALGGRGREYDFTIFSIVKYFHLLMDNNPNVIDSLFTSQECVLHITTTGNTIRDNRRLFLHKGSFHRYKGYAYSSRAKLKGKQHFKLEELKQFEKENDIDHSTKFEEVERELKENNFFKNLSNEKSLEYYNLFKEVKEKSPSRSEKVKDQEYDYKFAYHVVRLLNQAEQILIEGDLDLTRNNEQLKSIRRGEWSLEQIDDYFTTKERELETLYTTSKIRNTPDEPSIKQVLLNCLEEHYGSLDKAIVIPDKNYNILKKIKELVEDVE